MENNLLYSESTDLNVKKNAFTETSRISFDQISGCHGLDELTHKINHCNEGSGFPVSFGLCEL